LSHTPYIYKTQDVGEWAKLVKETFGGLEVSSPDPSSFSASLETRLMGEITLAMASSTAATVWHDGSIGAFSRNERFLVKTQFVGESAIAIGQKVIELKPNDFLICDNTRSYALTFANETEILSIPIPHGFLRRFYAHPEELAFIRADRESAIHKVVADYSRSLWNALDGLNSENQFKRIRDIYFDLLIMGFNDNTGHGDGYSTVQDRHLERCRKYIEENYSDEHLSLEMIADCNSISKRYLQTIFSNIGQNVSNYITSVRLDNAAQMLRSRRFKQLSVMEIAYECGFKSPAHFTRAFKSRFDISPLEYRKRTF
jgi:AraC-like DNA-binding protein